MTEQMRVRLGLPVLLAAFLGGCATVQEHVREPEVKLHDVRVAAMSLADATVSFDLDIENPNPLGISMRGLSYRLELEDETLFEGVRDQGVRIGANDSSRVTLPFTFAYSDVFASLGAIRGKDAIGYRFSGDAQFGPFTIPYATAGTLPVPVLPELALADVRVDRLTMSGATVSLGLQVTNANRFPIRFNGLDYALELGDASVLRGQSTQRFEVEPEGSGTLRIPVTLDFARLTGLATQLRRADSLPVAFTGQVRLPAGTKEASLPYSWRGTVPLVRN